jgi:hypothetical protein
MRGMMCICVRVCVCVCVGGGGGGISGSPTAGLAALIVMTDGEGEN